jgi:hypothetical protein
VFSNGVWTIRSASSRVTNPSVAARTEPGWWAATVQESAAARAMVGYLVAALGKARMLFPREGAVT